MIEFDIASIVPMIEWAGDNVTHRVIIFIKLVTAIILLLLYIHPCTGTIINIYKNQVPDI